MATTKHTHPVVFGRKVAGCPRCVELANGAPPVRWSISNAKRNEALFVDACKAHFAPGGPHSQGKCGPVCTFGDW